MVMVMACAHQLLRELTKLKAQLTFMKQRNNWVTLIVLSACFYSQSAISKFELGQSVLLRGVSEGYSNETSNDDDPDGLRFIIAAQPTLTLESNSLRTISGLRLSAQFLQIPDDEDYLIKPEVDAYLNTTLPNSRVRLASFFLVRDVGIDPSRSTLAFDPDAADYATVFSLNIIPSLLVDVGLNTEFSGVIRLNTVRSDDDRVSGSNDQGLDFTIGTRDLVQGRVGWFLNSQHDRSEIDTGELGTFSEAQAGLRTLLTDDWQLFASAGKQWIGGNSATLLDAESAADSDSGIDDESQSGRIWDVGLTWRPREQTSLQIIYGERLFGHWPRVIFEHSSDRSVSAFSWTREISRTDSELLDFDLDQSNSPFNQIDSPTGSNELGNTLSIQDILSISHFVEGRVSLLDINASWVSSLRDSAREETIILSATYERKVSRRWSWLISATDARRVASDSSVIVPQYRRIGLGLRFATSRGSRE